MIKYPDENGRYTLQKVTSSEFYKEHDKYIVSGVISEKLGEIILKMIFNQVYTGGMFSEINHSIKEEVADNCISIIMEKYSNTKRAKNPYTYLVNMISITLIRYKRDVFGIKSKDIYGLNRLITKKRKKENVIARFVEFDKRIKNTLLYEENY